MKPKSTNPWKMKARWKWVDKWNAHGAWVQNTFRWWLQRIWKPIFTGKLAGFGLRVSGCGKGVICFRHTLPSAQGSYLIKGRWSRASCVGTRAPQPPHPGPNLLTTFFSFLLRYSWFTVLYWFLLYSKVIQLYMYIHYFYTLPHYGLSLDIEYSSLCYTVGPCCSSMRYTLVCIY